MIKKITHLTTRELEEILNIWLTSNIEAHPFIPENYWQENLNLVREQLPQAEIYVYLKNDKIIAFLGMVETYIAGIFVYNSYRSQGIGQQLLQEAKSQYNTLTLSVYAKNQNALHFYQKQGFQLVNKQIDATNELEYELIWNK
ncbi:N-acetyltransferase [Candidatus Enterococcus ikei]|uniref:N-acetyltransferase n=1 Tax=Candidatus Enterococcus ikei TaxID=2815326 RepID=A0ABS3GXW7_9ENTE|nr:N-acetyltransferase [Enterococcus sp. DIV0869a]MBO0440092.1 N-acetyltransferase [Enterococcus sp. DIV0869a]